MFKCYNDIYQPHIERFSKALLAGDDILTSSEQEKFAMELVDSGKIKLVILSLGARGAFLMSKEGIIHQNIPSVIVKSIIGAGDSMVAGLIYGLVKNVSQNEMLIDTYPK